MWHSSASVPGQSEHRSTAYGEIPMLRPLGDMRENPDVILLNSASSHGGSEPLWTPIWVSWGHMRLQQMASGSFQPFCRAHNRDRPTNSMYSVPVRCLSLRSVLWQTVGHRRRPAPSLLHTENIHRRHNTTTRVRPIPLSVSAPIPVVLSFIYLSRHCYMHTYSFKRRVGLILRNRFLQHRWQQQVGHGSARLKVAAAAGPSLHSDTN